MLNPTTLFKSLKTSEKNETDAVKDSNQENYGSLYQVQGKYSILKRRGGTGLGVGKTWYCLLCKVSHTQISSTEILIFNNELN